MEEFLYFIIYIAVGLGFLFLTAIISMQVTYKFFKRKYCDNCKKEFNFEDSK